jgi:hypothetical protein
MGTTVGVAVIVAIAVGVVVTVGVATTVVVAVGVVLVTVGLATIVAVAVGVIVAVGVAAIVAVIVGVVVAVGVTPIVAVAVGVMATVGVAVIVAVAVGVVVSPSAKAMVAGVINVPITIRTVKSTASTLPRSFIRNKCISFLPLMNPYNKYSATMKNNFADWRAAKEPVTTAYAEATGSMNSMQLRPYLLSKYAEAGSFPSLPETDDAFPAFEDFRMLVTTQHIGPPFRRTALSSISVSP